MSLRPRYSLLTLLILTALVAVGVKYWQGPHRAIMTDPPTVEERSLLDRLEFSTDLNYMYLPVVNEYEYINEWNSRRYLYLKGHSTGKRPIPVHPWRESSEDRLVMWRGSEAPEQLAIELENAKREQVHCWFYQTNGNAKEMNLTQQLRGYAYVDFDKAITANCYFLTSRKKLYLFYARCRLGLMLKAVDLNEIEDNALRERIAAEIKKIPIQK